MASSSSWGRWNRAGGGQRHQPVPSPLRCHINSAVPYGASGASLSSKLGERRELTAGGGQEGKVLTLLALPVNRDPCTGVRVQCRGPGTEVTADREQWEPVSRPTACQGGPWENWAAPVVMQSTGYEARRHGYAPQGQPTALSMGSGSGTSSLAGPSIRLSIHPQPPAVCYSILGARFSQGLGSPEENLASQKRTGSRTSAL